MLCQFIRVTFLLDEYVPGLLEKAKYLLAEAKILKGYPLVPAAVARRLRGEELVPVAEIVRIEKDFSRNTVSARFLDQDILTSVDPRFEVHVSAGILPGVCSNNLFQSLLIDSLFNQVRHIPIEAEAMEREIILG